MISKTELQRIQRFRLNEGILDEVTQLGWRDTADCLPQRDTMYGTSEMNGLAVVEPRMDDDAASPAPTTFRMQMNYLDNVSGILPMTRGNF